MTNLETVLYDRHIALGAKMVPFADWLMPVQYDRRIIDEHHRTRNGAGSFDTCHMGKFRITGKDKDTAEFLDYTLTNDVKALKIGDAQYTLITSENGDAIDDAYLYKTGQNEYLLVVNAGNRIKDWEWLNQHKGTFSVSLEDRTEEIGMIALQGPNSESILKRILNNGTQLPKRNKLIIASIDGEEVIITKTGYTGESAGFEFYPKIQHTVSLWDKFFEVGCGYGIVPAGLGARDSLRTEAGFPLFGHELGYNKTLDMIVPVFANNSSQYAVKLKKGFFLGRAQLIKERREYDLIKKGELNIPLEERILKQLVQPLIIDGKRPPKEGNKLFYNGKHVGYVTSGNVIPITKDENETVALALIDSDIRYDPDKRTDLKLEYKNGEKVDSVLVDKFSRQSNGVVVWKGSQAL